MSIVSDMIKGEVRKKIPTYIIMIPKKTSDKAKVLILLILFEYLIAIEIVPPNGTV